MVDPTLTKMLNSIGVDLAIELEMFWMAENLEEYRDANMARIDNVLDLASETFKVVPEEIRSKKTWVYDRGDEPDTIIMGEEDF